MSGEFISSIIGNLVGFLACFSYLTYCIVKKRVFIRGKGWKTKEEAPVGYKLTIGLMSFISIGSLIALAYRTYIFYEL